MKPQQQREADALARAEERERERIAADALINAGLTPHQWAWRNGVCADLNRDARFLGGIHRDVEITGVYLEGATLVLPCRTATTPQRWAERMAGKHAESHGDYRQAPARRGRPNPDSKWDGVTDMTTYAWSGKPLGRTG